MSPCGRRQISSSYEYKGLPHFRDLRYLLWLLRRICRSGQSATDVDDTTTTAGADARTSSLDPICTPLPPEDWREGEKRNPTRTRSEIHTWKLRRDRRTKPTNAHPCLIEPAQTTPLTISPLRSACASQNFRSKGFRHGEMHVGPDLRSPTTDKSHTCVFRCLAALQLQTLRFTRAPFQVLFLSLELN